MMHGTMNVKIQLRLLDLLCLPVRMSVRMEMFFSYSTDFCEILQWGLLLIFVDPSQVWLKLDERTDMYMKICLHLNVNLYHIILYLCCSDVIICVVRLLFVLFYVVFVCKCVLPPGDNPIAVNKYIISYRHSRDKYKKYGTAKEAEETVADLNIM
jgi:hypothetical protein